MLPAGKTRLDQRRECVLAGVEPGGRFLEIGPSHNPTLARRDGFDTRNADHLTRSGLVEKYGDHTDVDLEAIEDVDYVLIPGVPFIQCIDEQFDLILAAHVLEHTTSLIHFVNDCTGLLRPGGTLALILPDQRFCFDRFRERSSLGSVIDAAAHAGPVHSAGTLTEFALYATKRKGSISWGPGSGGAYEWVHGLDDARELVQASADQTYIDVHHWVFTPHHLRLLLHDLADTGHIALRESFFHDTVGNEFFLSLTRDGAGPPLPREDLVTLADAERQSYGPARFRPPGAGQNSAHTADRR